MKQFQKVVIIVVLICNIFSNCGGNKMETEFEKFLQKKMEVLPELEKAKNLAAWEAAVTGKTEAYTRQAALELKFKQELANPKEYARLKEFIESGQIKAPLLKRQLELLYHLYTRNQMDSLLLKKITNLEASVQNKFSVFRGKIDGQEVTNNLIQEILKNETDVEKREKAWYASKMVGEAVKADLLELVTLRNDAARQLGYENYFIMSLELAEQKERDLLNIFDKLAELTEEPFKKIKNTIDDKLARNCGIIPAMLRPWHYHDPFFQEAPMVAAIDLDKYYADQDVKVLTEKFFNEIDLPVEAIFANSDLYEKPGKNPHAFCSHIDRSGDVRILMNLQNDVYWMETTLHESGHAVYDKYLDFQLPYLLREPAHAFATEAIAMFFGRLARNPFWMQEMLNLPETETSRIAATVNENLRMQQLIFARWTQVMFRFEKALYQNPDQNLNKLWWDLVEKYQMVTRPANRDQADWAAKIHFTIAPAYYHNYMLGELMASQLYAFVGKNIFNQEPNSTVSLVKSVATGNFLRENIFQQGNKFNWQELLEFATGETLNPGYFVDQFVQGE
ncbi:M2 family metallopeptidase [candidate division KSB1 bacterium]|nr:M2 family metallopeptidase [candidate division KSB1 bacterium]